MMQIDRLVRAVKRACAYVQPDLFGSRGSGGSDLHDES
ncbi:hypothetical protein CPter291_4007 [Collimonas pratensis]|uniref:Uncharacterized protein n=1 Tax=Collimonas pratensis TaxID=279113 RepID=A0ABM5ZB16_9BURK|nr:hypothetical protein CPter291_4007 [Collimonas pratensis]